MLHSFLFFLAILLSSSERESMEVLRSLGRDNKELFVNNQEGKKGEKDERERCVIMKTTSDLSKRIKKTKHRAACVVMATQQQTVGEEDEGKRERRED